MDLSATFPVDVKIPKDALIDTIIDRYAGLKDQIQCGLCGRKHNNGCQVSFRRCDGAAPERGLIGHMCGRQIFQDSWTLVNVTYNQKLKSEENQKELEQLLSEFPTIVSKLNDLKPGLTKRRHVRNELYHWSGAFLKRCATVIKEQAAGGPLPGGKLEGELFFSQDKALTRTESILKAIEKIEQMVSEGAAFSVLRRAINAYRNAVANLKQIEWEVEDGLRALTATNMKIALGYFRNIPGDQSLYVEGSKLVLRSFRTSTSKTIAELEDLN